MKTWLVFSLLAAVGFCGCSTKKKEAEAARQSAASLPPEEAVQIEKQFVPKPNAPAGGTIQERLNGAIQPELTVRLKQFIDAHNGRMPESIYEFANTLDTMPPVPPGMKYMIDPADKTVKAVMK